MSGPASTQLPPPLSLLLLIRQSTAANSLSVGAWGSGADSYWRSYWYDNKTGNRTEMIDHAATGDTSHGYVYSATQPHALTGINTSGLAGTDSVTYGYDSTGNTTSRPDRAGSTQTLTWDIDGQLSRVVNGTEETSFVYDADGERLIRRDNTGNAALFMANTEVRSDSAGAISATIVTERIQRVAPAVAPDPGSVEAPGDEPQS